MTVLSDGTIRQQIEDGRITIEPYDETAIQPSSIDIRLDRFFLVLVPGPTTVIDPLVNNGHLMKPIEIASGKPFTLHPGDFVLGSTAEIVGLPYDISAKIEGKSSLGRLGLLTHITAGYIDPGFSGHITLEFSNVTPLPILLWPGMRVGQISFSWLDAESQAPYGKGAKGSKYQNQRGPVASRYYLNRPPDELSA